MNKARLQRAVTLGLALGIGFGFIRGLGRIAGWIAERLFG